MSKSFADLTPEQRSAWRGMWIAIEGRYGGGILIKVDEKLGVAHFFDPLREKIVVVSTNKAIPDHRHARAWTKDGYPPLGQWETGTYNYDPEKKESEFTPDSGLFEPYTIPDEEPLEGVNPKNGRVRQWVGEWEALE